MRYFPIFLDLDGRTVFVAGGGAAAANKLRLFAKTNARLICVSPRIEGEIAGMVSEGRVKHYAEDPSAAAFGDAVIVIAATESDADETIAARAAAAGLLVNAVDKTPLCSFITPSIVDRARVIVAIGTEGAAPVLARRVRERIEASLHENLGALADFIGKNRTRAAAVLGETPARRAFWEKVVDGRIGQLVLDGRENEAFAVLDRALSDAPLSTGETVDIAVVVSPRLADDLTLRALRTLQDADLLVHFISVPGPVVDRARRDAVRITAASLPELERALSVAIAGTARRGSFRVAILLPEDTSAVSVEALVSRLCTDLPGAACEVVMTAHRG